MRWLALKTFSTRNQKPSQELLCGIVEGKHDVAFCAFDALYSDKLHQIPVAEQHAGDAGELLPGKRVAEDQNTHSGKAMPEFPGYTGPAVSELPVIKVKAVTTRKNPIMQTCIGPSEEHVSMAGIPTEASIAAKTNSIL